MIKSMVAFGDWRRQDYTVIPNEELFSYGRKPIVVFHCAKDALFLVCFY